MSHQHQPGILPNRAGCHQCPADEQCTAYMGLNSFTTPSTLCQACLHPWAAHSHIPLPATHPNKVFERGGHRLSGCGGFDSLEPAWNAQTLCIACGKKLFVHDVFSSDIQQDARPLQSQLQAQSTSVPTSGNRPATTQALMGGYRSPFSARLEGSTNSMPQVTSRNMSMQRNRGRVISTGEAHFGRRNPRALLGLLSSTQSHPPPTPIFEALVAVFPLAIFREDQVGVLDGEEFTPSRLTYPTERIESCLNRFRDKNLLASISINPNDPDNFFPAWDSQLRSYLKEHNWTLPANGSHGSDFEKKPYRIIVPQRVRGGVVLDKPKVTLTAKSFNATTLSKSPFVTVPNTFNDKPNRKIYFIAPIGGNLMGWIDRLPGGQGQYSPHRCTGHRFYQGWDEGDFSQGELAPTDIECFNDCTCARPIQAEVETDIDDLTTIITPAGSSLSHSNVVPHVHFGDDLDDEIAEREAEMIQTAIWESRQYQANSSRVGESSTSVQTSLNSVTGSSTSRQPNQDTTQRSQTTAQPQPPRAVVEVDPVLPTIPYRSPNAYVEDTAAVQEFFSVMEENFPHPRRQNDKLKFTLPTGTVQQAARIFLNYLHFFTAKEFGLDEPAIDVDNHWEGIVENTPHSIAAMIMAHRHSWKVGAGIGDGVRSAVFDEVMKLIFENPLHFTKNEKTNNYILALPATYSYVSNSTGVERKLQLMTAGLFTAIYMLLNRKAPPLVSGILVHAVINGYDSIDEDVLLRHLCPDFREDYLPLRMLALDQPVKVGSKLQYLVEIALETPICNLEGPPNHGGARSPEYHQGICQGVLGFYLLGTSRQRIFHDHLDVRAFGNGFNIIMKNGIGFGKLLEGKSVELFPGLWCREISSPDILLQHLCISAIIDEDHDPRPLSSSEVVICEAIKRYFRMPGHPDCGALRAILPKEWFSQHQDDPTIRSRLFVQASTGSFATPTESDWKITIELARDRGKGVDTATPRPLEWHLCTRSVTLWYDEDLVNACLEPIPQGNSTFSRRFDGWFHSQIVMFEGESSFSMV